MKKAFVLVVLVVALMSVVACSSGTPAVPDTKNPSPAESKTAAAIDDAYAMYVADRKGQSYPYYDAKKEGVKPVLFAYDFMPYNKQSGEKRNVLVPVMVTPAGVCYDSDDMVTGISLDADGVKQLLTKGKLSAGLDILPMEGKKFGREQAAAATLEKLVDSVAPKNDYKFGLIGYTYVYRKEGSSKYLYLSILPDGTGYVAREGL